MKKGKIILLNGVSSSGKSTLVQKLTEIMPDYLKLSLDDIGRLVWSMRSQRRNPPTSEIAVQSNYKVFLKPYLFHRVIRMVYDYSYNVIIDAVIENDLVLEDWRAIFKDDEIVYVAVHCPIEELEKREKLRGDRPIGLAKSQLENFHVGIKYDIEVNTFDNTVDECVQKIVDFLMLTNNV